MQAPVCFGVSGGHLRQIVLAGQVAAPAAFHGTGGQRDSQDR